MVKDKLQQINFSESSHGFRKTLSIILFIAMLCCWGFIIGYNAYVALASSELRVVPGDFGYTEGDPYVPPIPIPDFPEIPTSITLGGTIFIENDHANSLPINEFYLYFTIYAQDGTRIKGVEIINSTIPAQANTTLDLTIKFDIEDYSDPLELLELLESLETSEYLIFNFSLSFKYALTQIQLKVSLQSELGGP